MDKDKSGTVTLQEFKAKANDLYLPPNFAGNFDERFEKFSKKKNGLITLDV